MREGSKILAASVVVSTLVLGSAVTTTSNANVASAQEVMSQHDSGIDAKTQKPYYNYDGYTTYDGAFTQDEYFVQALKYDNVTINGYKVDATASGGYTSNKHLYDQSVQFNEDGDVLEIVFFTKPDSVTKAAFKDAHHQNEIIEEGELGNEEGNFVKYKTMDGSYTAFFDANDNLIEITITNK